MQIHIVLRVSMDTYAHAHQEHRNDRPRRNQQPHPSAQRFPQRRLHFHRPSPFRAVSARVNISDALAVALLRLVYCECDDWQVSWQSVTVQIVTSGAVGAIAGGIAGNFKPFFQLNADKRLSRFNTRKAMVDESRQAIEELRRSELAARGTPGMLTPAQQGRMFGRHAQGTDAAAMAWFIRLRPHLSADAQAQADELAAKFADERPLNALPDLLLSEVNRSERDWGLI
jgi:hypothetical protein